MPDLVRERKPQGGCYGPDPRGGAHAAVGGSGVRRRAGAPQLAERVDEATAAASGGRALRRGSLRFARTVALPVGIQGPTAGVIIGPAIIASIVGEPGALAQVLALVAMGFVAYAFIVFTRAFNTAGSVYGFNATALGPGYGFVSAWLLLLVYICFAAGVTAPQPPR